MSMPVGTKLNNNKALWKHLVESISSSS